MADFEVRPFAVICFLEDTRARTRHVYITPGEAATFHVATEAGQIDFFVAENESKQIVSIMAGCFKSTYREAFEFAYPHLLRIFSQWSFRFRRPVSLYETRVIDKRHRATWGIPPICPNTLPSLTVPMVTLSNASLSSLVAVFREGMNATSSAHRFLSYFKILEAYPSGGPFGETNRASKSLKREVQRQSPTVTLELMAGAFSEPHHREFVGKKATWCRDRLNALRNAVGHPFVDGNQYIDLDSVEGQAQLATSADLLERLAAAILDEEFRLWGELSQTPGYTAMSKSYRGSERPGTSVTD